MFAKKVVAYIDCFGGVAEDMLLSALVDAGAQLPRILEQLKTMTKLSIAWDWSISYELVKRGSKVGAITSRSIKSNVRGTNEANTVSLAEMIDYIESSKLTADIQRLTVDVFKVFASARSQIQELPTEKLIFNGAEMV